MLNILNIQFGRNKNNTDKVKKIYNQGNIITARPKTSKFPYKILSVKESPKINFDEKKTEKKNTKYIFMNKLTYLYSIIDQNQMKKSFSFKDKSLTKKYNRNKLKSKQIFEQSSIDNNFSKFSYNNKNEFNNYKINKKLFFESKAKSPEIEKNKKVPILNNDKKLFINIKKGNDSNKPKISSYNMSRYNEIYIKNNKEKSMNKIDNPNSKNIYSNMIKNNNNNNEDNIQVMNFLSEIVNYGNLKNNFKENYNNYYYTTNNIFINNFKNKNNARNLILDKQFDNYKNKVNISYDKKPKIKPIIINMKGNFDIDDNRENNKNYNNTYKKKIFESDIKLKKVKSPGLSTDKSKEIKSEKKYNSFRPFSAFNNEEIKKNKSNKNMVSKDMDKDKDIKEDKDNIEKFKIKSLSKKKLIFKKEAKIKNKKSKIFKSYEINNGYQKYLDNLNNHNKFLFNYKSNESSRLEFKKNLDIYNYIVLPKEAEGIIDETSYRDHTEYKPVNK